MRNIDTVFNHSPTWIVTWRDKEGYALLIMLASDLADLILDPEFPDLGGTQTHTIELKQA